MLNKFFYIVLSCSFLISCQHEAANSSKVEAVELATTNAAQVSTMPKNNLPKKVDMKELSFTATVTFFNLEGGFFGLVTKEGKHWLPMNLKKEFHQHGAVIKVKGKEIKDMMTIQQWGTPFSITHIELISAGRKAAINNL